MGTSFARTSLGECSPICLAIPHPNATERADRCNRTPSVRSRLQSRKPVPAAAPPGADRRPCAGFSALLCGFDQALHDDVCISPELTQQVQVELLEEVEAEELR